ncbi:MAG: 2OG-Fe(II) oxygenase [Lysobacteraceae bacterium]
MHASAQAVSRALARFGADARFASRFTVKANPGLHVEGVGEVTLPVTIQGAHRLCAVARPAHHGYKDQTRLDPRVRDTWEIPASAISFDSPQWSSVLTRALKRIAAELGLPSDVRLDANLHNLLIYGPGQFFAVHQDSEKADGMLGTLVVTLPSKFSGGELVVSHQGETLGARGSAGQLGLLAFYADCLHEVRAVKQGYRIALTYNLVTQGDTQPAELPTQDLDALVEAVQRFWQAPLPPRWQDDAATDPPDRLVYLLDHEYTPSGLAWTHLKGADSIRAQALHEVARRLDADIFLTLADVHETWQAQDEYSEYGYNSRDEWDEENHDDEDHPDSGKLELGDLIDSEIELRHWLSADGSRLESDSAGVGWGELCLTRPSSDCAPFRSEYEGYMGNYGNTLDRWYHRAAVVMWPRERAFAIRARQAPGWAIEQIVGLLEAGDTSQAQSSAQQLLPFWTAAMRRVETKLSLDVLLPVVVALKDAGLAAQLLEPFILEQVAASAAPAFAALLEQYGTQWCEQHWQPGAASRVHPSMRLEWLADALPAWSRAVVATRQSGAVDFAAKAVEERWRWLQQHVAQLRTSHGGSALDRALVDTSPAWLGLILASQEIDRPALQQVFIGALLSPDLPLPVPLSVLRKAAQSEPRLRPADALAPLHARCLQTLTERLARHERAADDWSIPLPVELETPAAPPSGYGMGVMMSRELGPTLTQFLRSPDRQRLEWPLAEAKRQLIQQFIDHHELPVRCETRRSGRPYALVLEKTRDLFEHETVQRRQWAKNLAWLRKSSGKLAR